MNTVEASTAMMMTRSSPPPQMAPSSVYGLFIEHLSVSIYGTYSTQPVLLLHHGVCLFIEHR